MTESLPEPTDFEIPDFVPDDLITDTGFNFDATDREDCVTVINDTLEVLAFASEGKLKKVSLMMTGIFRKGPDALFISFTALCTAARSAVTAAFGPEVTGEDALWQMTPREGISDSPNPDAHLFAGEFMTAYMNRDHQGAMTLFSTLLDKEMDDIIAAHMAMLAQTHFIFMYCADRNPEAMSDFVQPADDEEEESE